MTSRKRAALLSGLEALTLALNPDDAAAHAAWLEDENERRAPMSARGAAAEGIGRAGGADSRSALPAAVC